MTINAEIIEHATGCKLNGVDINDLVRQWANSDDADVTDAGDIWIQGPQTGSWLDDDDKREFITWLKAF